MCLVYIHSFFCQTNRPLCHSNKMSNNTLVLLRVLQFILIRILQSKEFISLIWFCFRLDSMVKRTAFINYRNTAWDDRGNKKTFDNPCIHFLISYSHSIQISHSGIVQNRNVIVRFFIRFFNPYSRLNHGEVLNRNNTRKKVKQSMLNNQ